MIEQIDWEKLNQRLAWHKTPEEFAIRNEQWAAIDVNGNGYLSLTEVEKGIRDVIQLPEIFDTKKVITRAFHAAKDVHKKKSKSIHDLDSYIERAEYRLLLKYLRQYSEYWIAFKRLDSDCDSRIGYEEFMTGKEKMEEWGIDMSNPEAMWNECDANGGGKLLFDEFAAWAIEKGLDIEDDED